MDASPIAPASPLPLPQGLRPAIRLFIAVGCALALVLAIGAYLVVFSVAPIKERHVEALSQGQQTLDVPLMTLYTAPPIPGAGVESSVWWNISSANPGPSTTYRFGWNLTSQEDEPVRFIFNSTLLDRGAGPFQGSDDGVLFYPAGVCRAECTRAGQGTGASGPDGVRLVVYEVWQLKYAVRRVTEVTGTQATSFLEVDFAFARIQSVGDSMPAANVTDPNSNQRASLGIHRQGAGSRVTWSVQGLASAPEVPDLFRNQVITVTFDAGRLGTLSARLDSEYSWSSADDYSLSFSASTETTIRVSIDLRFGSLFIDYVEWPHP